MLVSGNKETMRHDVTYGAFPSCTYQAFQLRVVVQFVSSFKACVRVAVFSLTLPPLLVDLVSIGLVSISTDLVSVTVSGGGCRSQSCHGYLRALLKLVVLPSNHLPPS